MFFIGKFFAPGVLILQGKIVVTLHAIIVAAMRNLNGRPDGYPVRHRES